MSLNLLAATTNPINTPPSTIGAMSASAASSSASTARCDAAESSRANNIASRADTNSSVSRPARFGGIEMRVEECPPSFDDVSTARAWCREQPELGPFGAQQVLGLREHGVEHLIGLACSTDEMGEVVQQAQAFVALTQRAAPGRSSARRGLLRPATGRRSAGGRAARTPPASGWCWPCGDQPDPQDPANVSGPPCHFTAVATTANPTISAATTATRATSQLAG